MAVPAYLREAAKKGTASKKVKTVAKAVGGGATKSTFMKMMMGGKGLGVAAKAHPLGAAGAGLTGFFILQMLMNAIKGHAGTFMQQGLQGQQIEGQMAGSQEDAYYRAMLPQLSQQRQGAQSALLQAILSGSGQTMPVPGERIIGGG